MEPGGGVDPGGGVEPESNLVLLGSDKTLCDQSLGIHDVLSCFPGSLCHGCRAPGKLFEVYTDYPTKCILSAKQSIASFNFEHIMWIKLNSLNGPINMHVLALNRQ